MKSVLLIVAHKGFQPVEYSEPKRILQAGGVKVFTASNKGGEAVSSLTFEKIGVDVSLDKVNVGDYDGVFFIGGPGAMENLDNELSYKVAKAMAVSGKLWGAICVSPRILAHAGVLAGHKVTGWDEDGALAKILERAGAEYVRKPVVEDGNLITAKNPQAATDFGRQILEKLK